MGFTQVAEAIGTMIQNRKDISIYINTQPGGREEAGFFRLSRRGRGGREAEAKNLLHLFWTA